VQGETAGAVLSHAVVVTPRVPACARALAIISRNYFHSHARQWSSIQPLRPPPGSCLRLLGAYTPSKKSAVQ